MQFHLKFIGQIWRVYLPKLPKCALTPTAAKAPKISAISRGFLVLIKHVLRIVYPDSKRNIILQTNAPILLLYFWFVNKNCEYDAIILCVLWNKVTCFAEAGGQHVSGMAKAVEQLGLRACLAESIMDCGEGLPPSWATRTTEDCIQVDSF